MLRGPQGTLYGRNATAGVVNIISAKPKFRYEAKFRRTSPTITPPASRGWSTSRWSRTPWRCPGRILDQARWLCPEQFPPASRSTAATFGRPYVAALRAQRLDQRQLYIRVISEETTIACGRASICAARTRPGHAETESPSIPTPRRRPEPAPPIFPRLSAGASLYSDEAFQVPNGMRCPTLRRSRISASADQQPGPLAATSSRATCGSSSEREA